MGQKTAGMREKVTEGGRVLSEQDFRWGAQVYILLAVEWKSIKG